MTVISNLIRFINEFWYVNDEKENKTLDQALKEIETNNANSFNSLKMKIKKFNDLKSIENFIAKKK